MRIKSLGISERQTCLFESTSENSHHIKVRSIFYITIRIGFTPDEEPINYDAPVALFTNMPIKSLCAAVEEQGVPVKISNSCGLYVCNRLYYEALMLCKEQPQMQAIFVHLPFYKGHPSTKHGKSTMPLSQMVRAIEIIIENLYFFSLLTNEFVPKNPYLNNLISLYVTILSLVP